jgi:hypothetical protein
MGIGVLEDKHMQMPPGTAKLDTKFDTEHHDLDAIIGLKKRGDTILIPQPSDDPNDPLNWSELWKNSILAILGISVAVTIS